MINIGAGPQSSLLEREKCIIYNITCIQYSDSICLIAVSFQKFGQLQKSLLMVNMMMDSCVSSYMCERGRVSQVIIYIGYTATTSTQHRYDGFKVDVIQVFVCACVCFPQETQQRNVCKLSDILLSRSLFYFFLVYFQKCCTLFCNPSIADSYQLKFYSVFSQTSRGSIEKGFSSQASLDLKVVP